MECYSCAIGTLDYRCAEGRVLVLENGIEIPLEKNLKLLTCNKCQLFFLSYSQIEKLVKPYLITFSY